jgi:hypothetical protein
VIAAKYLQYMGIFVCKILSKGGMLIRQKTIVFIEENKSSIGKQIYVFG